MNFVHFKTSMPAIWACALLPFIATSYAQIITGSISGVVTDPSGAVVMEAKVTLTAAPDGRQLEASTNEGGAFIFTGLEPGEYKLSVAKSGFKTMEKTGLILPTGVRLSAGTITLTLGAVSEVVSVKAEPGTVQTESAERSGTVTSSQLAGLLVESRSVPTLVQLLPGVVLTTDTLQSVTRQTSFTVLGNRINTNYVTVDGVRSTDLDNGYNVKLQTSQDAVSEVEMLTSNYQAEYGRGLGGTVNIITKSGTRDFHGLGSYFKRNEEFDANNFFNNLDGLPKPRDRHNIWTYNIGGPVYIPGKLNQNRDKLFFFWNQEFLPVRTSSLNTITVPTDLERVGNFSQSLESNGQLIVVKDPTTGQPFSGNVVPASRIDPNGQALLKFFPEPNFSDQIISKGQYNYVFSGEQYTPNRTDTLKLDYNLDSKNMLFGTYSGFHEDNEGFISSGYYVGNWPQLPLQYVIGNKGVTLRYTRIISPTVINEFQFAWFTNPEKLSSTAEGIQSNTRTQAGFNLGMLNSTANPLGLLPNATFGGVPNAGNLLIADRYPVNDPDQVATWTEKLTIVRGTHTLKVGAYIESFWRGIAPDQNNFGSFNFGVNANNPLDTGYAYSNAALGVFNSYTEASTYAYQNARGGEVDWFIQDTWKVTRRLTFDYGVRLYWMEPTFVSDNRIAGFVPSSFDPTEQVLLIHPGINNQGQRVGVNPVTGQVFPAVDIGAIVSGVGNPFNGMVTPLTDHSYPRALYDNRGINYGPRFGFAYDPFGKGKTAIRSGFGIFYEPLCLNDFRAQASQPPLVQNPTINYGQLSTFLSSSGLLFPSSVMAVDRAGFIPNVMNFSFSIQQNIGFSTVLDVAYVAALGRHLSEWRNLNAIPFGTDFTAVAQDPTSPGKPLPSTFLRPIIGYNNIDLVENAGNSNYNSLQVSANRRFTGSLQFGFSWTWSKAMDLVDADMTEISGLLPARQWDYGPASFDRTHVVKINWLWNVPNVPWRNVIAKGVLHNWQLSGIDTFQSGGPTTVTFTTTTGMDITGSPTNGPRINVIGNPMLVPESDQTALQYFNPNVFQLPAVGTYGNAGKTLFRGPGIDNWDIALFKDFPIYERSRLQLRWELYNAFNHTQFGAGPSSACCSASSGLNTVARFNAAGNQINMGLGQFISALNARQMQLALRFSF